MAYFLQRSVQVRLLSLNSDNLLCAVTIPCATSHAIELDGVSDARPVRFSLSLDESVTRLDHAQRNRYCDWGGEGTNIFDVFHFNHP